MDEHITRTLTFQARKYRVKTNSTFDSFAKKAAHWAGRPIAFVVAVGIIIVWAILGPIYHYSDTWQLVINTGTTIITFLMVFVIQNTQNRDTGAIQIKLDELIRAIDGAHNALLDLESIDGKELDVIRKDYEQLAKRAREALQKGQPDTGHPEIRAGDSISKC